MNLHYISILIRNNTEFKGQHLRVDRAAKNKKVFFNSIILHEALLSFVLFQHSQQNSIFVGNLPFGKHLLLRGCKPFAKARLRLDIL